MYAILNMPVSLETGIDQPMNEDKVRDEVVADVRATLQGDDAAFGRIVARYQSIVFKQMWRFTRDPLVQDELVQEVFIEVYRSLKNFRAEAPFLHWVRRIATRVGYRYWKKKERRKRLDDALYAEPLQLHTDPDVYDPSEAAEKLHQVLELLPAKERLILTLMYFEGYDAQETADAVGWNANLVRVRAHRARKKLKKLLQDAGVEIKG